MHNNKHLSSSIEKNHEMQKGFSVFFYAYNSDYTSEQTGQAIIRKLKY